MEKTSKKIIILYDQYQKPRIKIEVYDLKEEKIEEILKKYSLHNLFSENNWGLFKQDLEKDFRNAGSNVFRIERLNYEDTEKDHLLFIGWKIQD